jgi:hypothetical protein
MCDIKIISKEHKEYNILLPQPNKQYFPLII